MKNLRNFKCKICQHCNLAREIYKMLAAWYGVFSRTEQQNFGHKSAEIKYESVCGIKTAKYPFLVTSVNN